MRLRSGAKVVENAHFRVKSSGLLTSLVCGVPEVYAV